METQEYVLVNDENVTDFRERTKHGILNGYRQALNIPANTGPLFGMQVPPPARPITRKALRSRFRGAFALEWSR